jgi:hypothetical protein
MFALAATDSLPAQDAQAEKAIIAAERAIHESIVKGNVAGFKQQVAADSWAIDAMMGRMSTAEFIKSLDTITKDMKMESWDITDTQVIWADANSAVLTYKWSGKGTYQGQPIPSPVWASTVWTKRGGKWTAVFHQETIPMPPPPPAKK